MSNIPNYPNIINISKIVSIQLLPLEIFPKLFKFEWENMEEIKYESVGDESIITRFLKMTRQSEEFSTLKFNL